MAYHFIFSLPPDISGTTDPTEMVHLSMSAEMRMEYNYIALEMICTNIFY